MPATATVPESLFRPSRAAAPDGVEADPVRRRRAQLHAEGVGRALLDGETVRWALMYPDAYEVGLPNQGVQILYEVLNERDWIVAERTYSVWPDMEAVMRDGDSGRSRSSPSTRTGRSATSTSSASASRPSSATPTCSTPSTSPGSRCTRSTAPTTTRSCSRAATRRSTPSRSRTSSTRRCSATARRSCSRSPRWCASGRARAGPAAATSCCGGWRSAAGSTSRGSTTSRTPPTRRSRPSYPTGPASRSGSASTR